MSRTVFAGATYNLKRPDCTGDLQGLPTGTPVSCLSTEVLSAWLRNPPALIPMDATQNVNGQYRGMPNLGLSEPQMAPARRLLGDVEVAATEGRDDGHHRTATEEPRTPAGERRRAPASDGRLPAAHRHHGVEELDLHDRPQEDSA